MRDPMWVDDANDPSTSSNPLISRGYDLVHGNSPCSNSGDNVFNLLARREVAPRTKRSTKRLWGERSKDCRNSSGHVFEVGRDARRGLVSWVEAESVCHLSAKYCPLLPPPRSTIAAAFSPDGKTLASTHGDHTVKIIDCQTGNCLKVLSGHRRTPWVVRFHPTCFGLLASGSLDHEVRLWDANTAECIGSRDFYRPIASIAFHAQGELLAVASGHKLYIWHYNRSGEASIPTVVLKTRRSLRAVHFHPHAAPFLLTAEVNDLDSSDSSMTLATSQGYVRYPPPTIYYTNAHSSDLSSLADELSMMPRPFPIRSLHSRDDARVSLQQADENTGHTTSQQSVGPPTVSVRLLTYSTPSGHYELLLSPIDPSNPSAPDEARPDDASTEMEIALPEQAIDAMETSDVQPEERNAQFFPFGDAAFWELPFLHGWLIGQSQAGQHMMRLGNASGPEHLHTQAETSNQDPVASSSNVRTENARVSGRSSTRHRSSRGRASGTDGAAIPQVEGDAQPVVNRLPPELATSLAAAAAAELPCTVKLRVWQHDIKDPCAPLEAEKCRLTIPHAVLCSEMGAHFSPCGRFLAACVACMLPHAEGEPGLQMQANHDPSGAATSPTRHPISAHQVMYELRIYSLEEATFGLVLASRAVRAAHCLTSIQFSPTSEHLLLAYGRRHSSLLKSVVIDGQTVVNIYTILEVYRVSDMELVRVLPSAEDEVNVACFHPTVGGGLVYGTKEGKLRILQYDSSRSMNCTASCFPDENLLEVPPHALEC